MAEAIINSYFQGYFGPVTGLSPTIRIWEVTATGDDLLIGTGGGTADPGPPGGGSVPGSGPNTDGIMVEIVDGATADGFYRYTFDTVNGYDETKKYLARVDGDPTGLILPPALRYQTVQFDPTVQSPTGIATAVWEADSSLFPASGSPLTMGGIHNDTYDKVCNIEVIVTEIRVTDVPAILALMDVVRKYNTNRTRIDPASKTLTVYDDDCVTPLRIFRLLDSTGAPNTEDVCERNPNTGLTDPQGGGTGQDGFPTC